MLHTVKCSSQMGDTHRIEADDQHAAEMIEEVLYNLVADEIGYLDRDGRVILNHKDLQSQYVLKVERYQWTEEN